MSLLTLARLIGISVVSRRLSPKSNGGGVQIINSDGGVYLLLRSKLLFGHESFRHTQGG